MMNFDDNKYKAVIVNVDSPTAEHIFSDFFHSFYKKPHIDWVFVKSLFKKYISYFSI